ncbi:hypothetical protein [Flavobacterium collinsii]|uniref:Outer membrane protein beta-barrel domain-containing protein n=1 Tax=Flavobacterium collinsii TaxID=1114861 RepID=A0A9W4X4Z0_9FLAO|nr:hypothetical protein [Flavobacterium collinsii]CAI2768668.1 conserved exported protein of unknown function [Flavobacterium collinsii]
MKLKILTFTLFIIGISNSNAQVQLQSFGGNDGFQFSTIIEKKIAANEKLSYFNFSNYYAPYDSISKGAFEMYHVLNYEFTKNIGVAIGNTFTNDDIIPQIGLSWTIDKEELNLNFFPALNYSLNSKKMGIGVYSLLEYTPKINEKWNSYNMLILDSDFTFKEHSESNQYIRIGAEFKKRFQFGLGLNFSESNIESSTVFNSSYGVFAGYTL